MARVHTLLYNSADLASIEIGEYLDGLVKEVADAFGARDRRIETIVDAEPMRVPLDTAVPLAFIAVEVLTNAFKHAFPLGRGGTITVSAKREGDRGILTIADDGVGLPAARAARRRALGLTIVSKLVQQIDGHARAAEGGRVRPSASPSRSMRRPSVAAPLAPEAEALRRAAGILMQRLAALPYSRKRRSFPPRRAPQPRARSTPERLHRGLRSMSRQSPFGHPFLLGFDEIEQALDRVAKAASDGYPPYNIERLPRTERDPERLRITLAVAGFTHDQLEITLEESQLVIRGRQGEDKTRQFLHRGIAARQFQRAFLLADGMEVLGADLSNGLLSIDLARPEPERIVRKIDIAARD